MLKKLLTAVGIGILIGVGIGIYLWNKPKTNYANETADIVISADSIFNSYSKNEQEANKLYLNKVIQVNGTVSQVSENGNNEKNIILQTADPMFGVSCTMLKTDAHAAELKAGDKTSIKGLCTGYITDVVITNGSVVR